MTNGEEPDQPHQTRLVLWHKFYEQILHSDRATVDIGVFALKVVMTINAGALLALLAAKESLEGAPGAVQFFVGLMSAALAALLSYIYQSLVTASLWNQFSVEFPDPGTPPRFGWAHKSAKVIIVIVLLLVFVSYGAFGWGTWSAISRIPQLPLLSLGGHLEADSVTARPSLNDRSRSWKRTTKEMPYPKEG